MNLNLNLCVLTQMWGKNQYMEWYKLDTNHNNNVHITSWVYRAIETLKQKNKKGTNDQCNALRAVCYKQKTIYAPQHIKTIFIYSESVGSFFIEMSWWRLPPQWQTGDFTATKLSIRYGQMKMYSCYLELWHVRITLVLIPFISPNVSIIFLDFDKNAFPSGFYLLSLNNHKLIRYCSLAQIVRALNFFRRRGWWSDFTQLTFWDSNHNRL